ncbi:SLBB domain-containing protein [Chitinophaga sancti]|uniref:SLBB domain-containing protein n=1 Tax=Chitinophaga sancti TaxID=1004 RepID=UPI002A75571B|nr:SLBB domain-containing protein [Chitinophaga sancti]WPQ64516.1 SLBB domain-containing protein [Chitinophaga sancti]
MSKKTLLLQLLMLFIGLGVKAQISTNSMTSSQLSQIKVSNLSDDQIRQIVAEMKKNNVSYDQIGSYAKQKGIADSEVEALKTRIKQLNLDTELSSNSSTRNGMDSTGRQYEDAAADTTFYWQQKYKKILDRQDLEKELKRRKIFGTELFSNKNLTFEPNLRMATPPNYKLAADDEVIIDVYGYSEVQHKLKVSPDGYIRIPYLGPVYVNGLTMAEATQRITKQLSTIYSGIKTGNTSVQVTLGNIRSIRILLIGEATQPGTYTLPSLATVANALYVSGGPNENGSFRNIDVIRNGNVVSTFDLYDFLVHGDLSNNVVLQDQDIVKVNPYKLRVEVTGEVKRPAIFEAKERETLQDIIEFAGGYTDNAFRDNIRDYRVNKRAREVVTIPADSVAFFRLKTGDKFYVDSVVSRYTNRVTIAGAVFHAGDFALEPNMTVADLIKKADGVQEEAVMSRGVIRRLQDDYTPSIVNFNVQDVLDGKENMPLKREDSVIIFSKLKVREEFLVKIDGEVNQPGYYIYGDSMHLEDLILLAGGLKSAASLTHVEISRRIHNKGVYDSADFRMAITRQFDLNADLSANGEANAFALQPFDEIMIRREPSYSEQANVIINGEIAYPGIYTINNKKERISDVIRRAGGLRPDASAEGALLLRKTFANSADSTFLSSKLQVFYNKLRDTSNVERVKDEMTKKMQLLGIELKKALANPGSKYDLYLEEGDVIRVPKKLQTVQMFGEVYFPKKVRFDKSFTFRDYVNGSGGFTATALRRRSYIVYANGKVKSTRKVLFFNRYPKVEPGSEIYVPPKKQHQGMSTGEAVSLASALASVALVIVTIINSTK